MKTFKECLAEDISAVFFNDIEFAEKVTINGYEMTVILNEVDENKPKGEYDYGYTNHIEANKIITLKSPDYEILGRPSQGERLDLNEEPLEILNINTGDGVVDIKVRVFR